MKSRAWAIAALVAFMCTTTGCAIPSEPSVARQAMAASTAPLTITAELDEPLEGASAQLTLTVTDVDNGDWNADQRPDSRVYGFHEVTLTPSRPSITRTFSANALEGSVTFTMIVSAADGSDEIVRVRLAYRDPHGWYVARPALDWAAFGADPPPEGGEASIRTTGNPAELIISPN